MELILAYGKKRGGNIGFVVLIFAAFHSYFFFFLQDGRVEYLLYLDFLLLILFLAFVIADYLQFVRSQKLLEELMKQKGLACRMGIPFENQNLSEHDVRILEEQLESQFQENCELQDYVAKWCHEMKLPLSTGFLIEEQIPDSRLRGAMREQLERMNQQVSSLLSGCRLQSPLFDLQVRRVSLKECVRTSVHNNQFFLIQKRFTLSVDVGEEMVYSDPSWLVYVLDQLIYNAVKYAKDSEPVLKLWAKREKQTIRLFVEDHGVGIPTGDLPRIFEKGFTGQNCHNGKYKSTGMGLYMAAKIIKRMGHELLVESEYGVYSRFCIVFQENEFFGNSFPAV